MKTFYNLQSGDDVTAELADAIGDANPSEPRVIFFPTGTWKISSPISVNKKNVIIRGAGEGATILRLTAGLPGATGGSPYGNFEAMLQFGALTGSGAIGGSQITTVTTNANRGSKVLKVASTAGLSAGDIIRLRMKNPQDGANDNTLGRHLYGELGELNAQRKAFFGGEVVDWKSKIASVDSGTQITLERPLRVDVKTIWTPRIFSWSPTVTEVGIENLTIKHPDVQYPGHHNEKGHFAILFNGVSDAWAKNVTIKDADRGITFSRAYNCTATGITLTTQFRDPASSQGTDQTVTGHYGIFFGHSHDNLAQDIQINTKYVHNLALTSFASGNVYSDVAAKNAILDHHGAAPYENLYTQIVLTQTAADFFKSGGNRAEEPNAGARETYWNITKTAGAWPGNNQPPIMTAGPDEGNSKWPVANFIGVNFNTTNMKTTAGFEHHLETFDGSTLEPANLYQAQLAFRLGTGTGSAPDAPSNLSATTVSSSQINLSWTDNAGNEDDFQLQRKTGGGAYSTIATPGVNSTSYSDTGLSADTTYTYRVRARNSVGNSAWSNEASDTTQSVGGGETRVTNGLIAYYPFTEGSGTTVGDQSGFGTALNLTISGGGVSWLGARNGISVTSSSTIQSSGGATKLHNAITASDRLTFEAWIKPANTTQGGPARVAGISTDTVTRNFTLGQSGSEMSARLRTSVTGDNGTPELLGGTVTTAERQYVVTWDGATVRLYENGSQVATQSRGGNLSSWDNSYPLVLINEATGDRAWLGELYLVAVYDRALSASEVAQNFNAGSSGGDTTPPVVQITAPADSATVSNSAVTVSATASDNVGVEGVQFKLDGANLGAEDTTSPYSVTWDTTTTSNGPHTLTAIARDAAGNSTTSSTIDVTVDNDSGDTISLFFETEKGTLTSPMTMAADGLAAAGQYVWVPQGTGDSYTSPGGPGAVMISYTAPIGDTYAVWARTIAPDGGSDSFFVKSDGNLVMDPWNIPDSTEWQWNKILNLSLSNGNHTLEFRHREEGAQLDAVILTTDLGFTPSGTEGNLPDFTGKTAVSGGGWGVGYPFEPETGSFIVEFDAVPSENGMNADIGISDGPASNHNHLAAIVRFYSNGKIDARNDDGYMADNVITYSAGTLYHFRLAIDVPTHTYSIYVTPEGGAEQVVGEGYAFRSEQNTVSQLDNVSMHVDTATGAVSVRNLTIGKTAAPAGGMLNTSVETQAGVFTAEFAAIPSGTTNTPIGFSDGTVTGFTGMAAIVRFSSNGNIDARDGSAYTFDNVITYSAGTVYHFRLVIDVPNHTYSIYVTPEGGTEQVVGEDYAFRTEQASVTQLDNWAAKVSSGSASVEIRGVTVRDTAMSARLKFEQTGGWQAYDSSGSGNHADIVNGIDGPVWILGGGLDFDGSDDHAVLPAGMADFTGGLTIAVWAFPTAVKNMARFVDLGNGTDDNNITFRRQGTSNDLSFRVWNGSTGGTTVKAINAIALDVWQHFAITMDASGNVTLYKNGTSVATGSVTVPSNVLRTLNYVGRSHWTSHDYFDGAMTDLRVYHRVLTGAEIQSLAGQ